MFELVSALRIFRYRANQHARECEQFRSAVPRDDGVRSHSRFRFEKRLKLQDIGWRERDHHSWGCLRLLRRLHICEIRCHAVIVPSRLSGL